MDSFFITLIEKKQLTHDVYELTYTSEIKTTPLPGQFLLCDTDSTNSRLRRSYSINHYEWGNFYFIIKAIPDGKGGSKAICKQIPGHKMQVWWPTGRFVLPDVWEKRIIFIGTGTGFAPLHFQAKSILEKTPSASVIFIFWVREEKDLFYHKILQEWSDTYPNFSYQFCLSQWKEDTYFQWRVTNYLRNNAELIDKNTLYSVCGSPSMVTEVRAILTSHDIEKDSVFFEQY